MSEDKKAKRAEYMCQYRKKPENLKRERKLERERYHQRHPDNTHPPDVRIEIHAPNRVLSPIPPPIRPPQFSLLL